MNYSVMMKFAVTVFSIVANYTWKKTQCKGPLMEQDLNADVVGQGLRICFRRHVEGSAVRNGNQ